MATGGRFNHEMAWIATLGGMVNYRTIVHASCNACGAWRLVNVKRLAAHLGETASLLDRRPPCREPGCKGRVIFHASTGKGTPSRPCVTVQGQVRRWRKEQDEKDRIKALRNG